MGLSSSADIKMSSNSRPLPLLISSSIVLAAVVRALLLLCKWPTHYTRVRRGKLNYYSTASASHLLFSRCFGQRALTLLFRTVDFFGCSRKRLVAIIMHVLN